MRIEPPTPSCIYTGGPPELRATLLDRRHPGQRGLLHADPDFLVGHFFLVGGEQRRVAELKGRKICSGVLSLMWKLIFFDLSIVDFHQGEGQGHM